MNQSRQQQIEQLAKEAAVALEKFSKVVAELRHPDRGCPWDLKQDHQSLRKYMVEEAYEAADAMTGSDHDHIKEELGDVLLQVVLNSQLLWDSDKGSLSEVIDGIAEKMIRRHPHVFSPSAKQISVSEVKDNWQKIKTAEKKNQAGSESVFGDIKGAAFPASLRAVDIGKRAREIAFDWTDIEGVWGNFRSEIDELEQELFQSKDKAAIEDELGDIYFSLAQVCRHLKVDPEVAAIQGNQKFLNRFKAVEELAAEQGIKPATAGTEQLDKLWQQVKALEKTTNDKKQP